MAERLSREELEWSIKHLKGGSTLNQEAEQAFWRMERHILAQDKLLAEAAAREAALAEAMRLLVIVAGSLNDRDPLLIERFGNARAVLAVLAVLNDISSAAKRLLDQGAYP